MSIDVAVLGATGTVGQKAIALLRAAPQFTVKELVASDKRIGQLYGEVVDWREPLAPLGEDVAAIQLSAVEQLNADYVISCLPTEVAERVEPLLAQQGKKVFSNAGAWRMAAEVPLLVPEINAAHLALTAKQQYGGHIVTNPNCAAVGVTLGLAPLLQLGAIEHVGVVTLQSVSGAGYPGVASFDVIGNTVPHINHEAEKISEETKKILGAVGQPVDFAVTAQVHRVAVLYGHVVTLQVMFKQAVDVADAVAAYEEWNSKFADLYHLYQQPGQPQAARQLTHDDMRVHIGHLRQGDLPNVLNLIVLTHNLVRGAAGAAIANMGAYLQFIQEHA
ncbi:MAG: aspartate-semialdehyde dehydrogenase [Gammaproteobacteria bacterium]|nr:aspartate-semialdehyde dehydrogenase [Gammaproteobacteria bacterium]